MVSDCFHSSRTHLTPVGWCGGRQIGDQTKQRKESEEGDEFDVE